MSNKRKLLSALKVRMGWLGYEFGQVTNPFESRFCIAVKNPDGMSRVVFMNESVTDYDAVAAELHESQNATDLTIITFGKSQEANDETG